jgi:putative transposase
MALCRYVERNPVAAGLVAAPADWPWSSCRAHAGLEPTPEWLDSDGMHAYLLGKQVPTPRDRNRALQKYRALVDKGNPEDADFWQQTLQQQMYLGDGAFVQRMRAQATPARLTASEIPKGQRRLPQTWADHLARASGDRDAALLTAYRDGGLTMTVLAEHTGLSVSHVGRLIGREQVRCKAPRQCDLAAMLKKGTLSFHHRAKAAQSTSCAVVPVSSFSTQALEGTEVCHLV